MNEQMTDALKALRLAWEDFKAACSGSEGALAAVIVFGVPLLCLACLLRIFL
jgi:hypothetical protein